ncbi:hypothetical protein BHU72_15000 [Desulfuribacillus stibiiarsenatis]|uniref:SLH domain-containing protein n=1 Tax=Desulfuribacillus stibiiarsenatis TaxID=1390249 RepID=A0A1E5L6G7_9FIRM|nr:S-layer homology domain-containing protein [Desulfuribacillus stibiiarsenatis]OEH85563.1 hypothetical protein BHU72_15000 [Desulfuribacillus stibiiarsenatis]
MTKFATKLTAILVVFVMVVTLVPIQTLATEQQAPEVTEGTEGTETEGTEEEGTEEEGTEEEGTEEEGTEEEGTEEEGTGEEGTEEEVTQETEVENTEETATFTDLDHWAKSVVEKLFSKDVVTGYPDGSFKPQNDITRAEFITLVNKVFGFTEKATINFSDVNGQWFADEIAKAVAAGYIAGYPDGTMKPNQKITREEAAKVIVEAFGFEEKQSTATFNDAAKTSEWAKKYVAIAKDKGYITGFTDGNFNPLDNIRRGETAQLVVNSSGEIVNEAGTYTEDVTTNVVVKSADVVLKDITIKGDLYIAQGIGEGQTILEGVTVEGKTFVNAGAVLDGQFADLTVKGKGNVEVANVVINNFFVKSAATVNVSEDAQITGFVVTEKAAGAVLNILAEMTFVANANVVINGKAVVTGSSAVVTGGQTVITAPGTDADKTALLAAVLEALKAHMDAVEGEEEGQYAEGSKETFKTAIDIALLVVNKATVAQEELDSALVALTAAVETFEAGKVLPEPTALELLVAAIAVAQEIYDGAVEGEEDGQYAVGSMTELLTVIEAAQAVVDNEEATEEEVVEALEALLAAVIVFEAGKVVPEPTTLELLEAAILLAQLLHDEAVEGEEVGQYAEGSKADLLAAIEAAQLVFEDEEATEEELTDELEALLTAVEAFEAGIVVEEETPVEVDTTVLATEIAAAELVLVDAIEGTEVGQYEVGSIATLQAAIDAAQAVLNNEEATQEEADLAVVNLLAAVVTFEAGIVV